MLEWAPGIDAMIGVFDRDHIVEAVKGPRDPEAAILPSAGQCESQVLDRRQRPRRRQRARPQNHRLTVNGKDGTGIGLLRG